MDTNHILGNPPTQATEILSDIFSQTDVIIYVYLSGNDFSTHESLIQDASETFHLNNLSVAGVPKYNLLIYSATVNGKQYIEYVPSKEYVCKSFVDFLNQNLVSGEITLDKETLLSKLQQISDFIESEKKAQGGDWPKCVGSVETKKEETELQVGKEVYLIDDTNWKSVLSLIPLTTRHFMPEGLESLSDAQKLADRKNHVQYSPTFVYHSENEQVDLDSVILLLRQFSPVKVTIVHDESVPKKIASVMEKEKWQYAYLSPSDYADKWKTEGYDSVVLSQNDYKTGMMASVFASYIRAPLIFSASELDDYKNYKTVYCIGSVQADACTKNFTLSGLQEYYKNITGTDKAILVNPKDIEEKSCESFEYTREFGRLTKAYCKDSLVSPILASVKNELMIFTDAEPLSRGVITEGAQANDANKFEEEILQKSGTVKSDIKKQVQMSDNNYLTVFASPRAVPLSASSDVNYRKALDTEYSEGKAVGRIFGITVSDTSSYVNRVLVFSVKDYSYVPQNSKLEKFTNTLLLAAKVPEQKGYIPAFNEQLKNNGYATSCFIEDAVLKTNGCQDVSYLDEDKKGTLEKSNIIIYDDDGSNSAWSFTGVSSSYLKDVTLSSPVVIAAACSGLDYYASSQDGLLGSNFIKSGALGYYGAVSVTKLSSIGSELGSRLLGTDSPSIRLEGYDLGNALTSVMNDKDVLEYFEIGKPGPFNYVLLGDPTVLLALPKKINLVYTKPKMLEEPIYCGVDGCARYCKEYTSDVCESRKSSISGFFNCKLNRNENPPKCQEILCDNVKPFVEEGITYLKNVVSGNSLWSQNKCDGDPCSLCSSGKATFDNTATASKKCYCSSAPVASGNKICSSTSDYVAIEKLSICGETKTKADLGNIQLMVNWKQKTITNMLPVWCNFPATLKLDSLDKECKEYRCKDESCTPAACNCFKTQKSPPKDSCLSYGNCESCVEDTVNKCKWSLTDNKCSATCYQNCANIKSQCKQPEDETLPEDVYMCTYIKNPGEQECSCTKCKNSVQGRRGIDIWKVKCDGKAFYEQTLPSEEAETALVNNIDKTYLCITACSEDGKCATTKKYYTDMIFNALGFGNN
ncbi:MAG: C25 family cysteine peptidase [Candidatus Aenigmarchaeota archaeon]|nr:C25 family cysteine peptidase [Candidatus Aenigmarchaeota archaeon]